MFKFVTDVLCVIFFFLFLEMLIYYKDYNELVIIKNYIEEDLKNNKIKGNISFENIEIIIEENGEYVISLYRDNFFSFESLKIIKYDGIVC